MSAADLDRRNFLRQLAAAVAMGVSLRESSGAKPLSAEDAARQSFALLKSDAIESYVGGFDDATLATFAVRFLGLIDSAPLEIRERTAAELQRESYAELSRTPPRELLRNLLVAWRLANPEVAAALEVCRLQTLGAVTAGRTAFVPYRLLNAEGEWAELRIHPRVITLEQQPNGWALQLVTEGLSYAEAIRTHEYQLPPLSVEVLGVTSDGAEGVYLVHRQTFDFPSGAVRIVSATYANYEEKILAAAKAKDFRTAERMLRETMLESLGTQLWLLKQREELEREVQASRDAAG